MAQAAVKHEGELVVAAIGPLTNLALACKLDIDFPKRVKALYVMGGAERAGNVTPSSEFNFHCDPRSRPPGAEEVSACGESPSPVTGPSPAATGTAGGVRSCG